MLKKKCSRRPEHITVCVHKELLTMLKCKDYDNRDLWAIELNNRYDCCWWQITELSLMVLGIVVKLQTYRHWADTVLTYISSRPRKANKLIKVGVHKKQYNYMLLISKNMFLFFKKKTEQQNNTSYPFETTNALTEFPTEVTRVK